MKRFTLLAAAATLAAASLALSSAPAHAGTVHVVLPGQSIQAAVDAASPGDTIQLVRGTYAQSVTISTDGITLRGAGDGTDGTVLVPPPEQPSNFCATVPPDSSTHGGGICVLGTIDPVSDKVTQDVADVHVTGIRVANEPGDGVVGVGTTGFRLDHVASVNSGTYGISLIASQHTTVAANLVDGVQSASGAGMFVGFTAQADMLIAGNKVRNAALGIFLQNMQDVRLIGNDATGNCTGGLVLDNAPAGSATGNITVAGNDFAANNAPCLGNPAIQGTGLLLIGVKNTTVVHNTATANSGAQTMSGGIVLVSATPFGGGDEGSDVIAHNQSAGNAPLDVMWDQKGSGITFSANTCGTSSPASVCTN